LALNSRPILNLIKESALPLKVKLCSLGEAAGLLCTKVSKNNVFYVVSSQKNAGEDCIRCLDSVYQQRYSRALTRHVMIDDASEDSTPEMIEKWMHSHPGHNVEFIKNTTWKGGCFNNLKGFRLAPHGSIICELNGDDWLPDRGVISYLNKVYQNPDVWMTYNSLITSKGRLIKPFPIPQQVVRTNTFRENRAYGRALHSFRQELFTHLREESLIDPETGDFFISGDDKAFHISLQELAGQHSRHLYRVTYVYNYSGQDPDYGDPYDQGNRTERIFQMPKYEPLKTLSHRLS